MNQKYSTALVALFLLAAVAGTSFALKAINRQRELEQENKMLRQQLCELQDKSKPAMPTDQSIPAPPPAETNIVVAQEAPPVSGATTTPPGGNPVRESREERMLRMKEEDPEGYAEWIKRREEFREKMKYNLAERTATLLDLDTAKMTEAEYANHEQLVNRMGMIWELMEQVQNPEENNRETMRQMFREANEVRPLLEQERAAMLRITGEELGYEGEDAQNFAEHISSIISATSLQMPRRGGRGGNR